MSETVMFYTVTEGGWMKARWASREEYEQARADGYITSGVSGERIPLAMVSFAVVTDLKDFRRDR